MGTRPPTRRTCPPIKGTNHRVYREGKCQDGTPGASCGQGRDCLPMLHPWNRRHRHQVCRGNKCQNGQGGSRCGRGADCTSNRCVQGRCQKPTSTRPPTRRTCPPIKGTNHRVYREGKCQDGTPGASCGQGRDCLPMLHPWNRRHRHQVCRGNKCQNGQGGSRCGRGADCTSNRCVQGYCKV